MKVEFPKKPVIGQSAISLIAPLLTLVSCGVTLLFYVLTKFCQELFRKTETMSPVQIRPAPHTSARPIPVLRRIVVAEPTLSKTMNRSGLGKLRRFQQGFAADPNFIPTIKYGTE